MDTQQFMEEFISRRTEASPSEAFEDPQVELFTQMSRDADLDSRVARLQEVSKDDKDYSDKPVKTEQEDVPKEFTEEDAGVSPDATESHPGETELLTVDAAAPLEDEGKETTPTPPVGVLTPDATPAELFVEPGEGVTPVDPRQDSQPDAVAQAPVEDLTPAVDPAQPPVEFTEMAAPVEPQEIVTPEAELTLPDRLRSKDFVPENLPFNFDEMLNFVQQQAHVPTLNSIQSEGGSPDDLGKLPEFPEVHTQPSTDFAEAKLGGLSEIWRQWERY